MKKIYLILILALFFSLPKLHAGATKWEGGAGTSDWTDADNWSKGVPGSGDNAFINTASIYPIIASGINAVVKKLTINSGATLTIESGATLTVTGILSNSAGSAGLIIKSDASGTGSLIHVTDGISASVEQYLTAEAWHYVSSPITGAMSYVFYDIYLRPFVESTDLWGANITEDVGLGVMQGYAAWVPLPSTSETVSFEGSLNNGSQSIAVTSRDYDPLTVDGGWNLVGNPYPSAIDWDAATGWTKTNVDNTIYFWKGVGGPSGSGNYYYYVGSLGEVPGVGWEYADANSGIIPAMQSFFVHVKNPTTPGTAITGTLGVTNDVRVHDNQPYYKETKNTEIPVIRLEASDANDLTDEAIVRFYSAATMEHDGDFDAYKLSGYMYPQLYSITPEQSNLAINTLPEYQNGTIIPFGFVSPEEGEYSINLTEFENFEVSTEIYLEDLFTGNFEKISDYSEYSFNSNPDQDPNRFLLHFAVDAADISLASASDMNIYSYDKNVYIQLPENTNNAQVNIFNMMGQKVISQSISGSDVNSIHVQSQSGYYLVTVQLGDQYYSEKILIK